MLLDFQHSASAQQIFSNSPMPPFPYCKGNPLYLVQLLNSLRNQNLISVNLANPCWAWDLEKISDLELSETVIKLFIEEMQKLDDQLRFGLTLAACLGSKLNRDILDILSKDLDVDLQDILTRVSEEGYLERLGDSFCFSHDKIEEAAYHMMSEDQKCKNHLRFGLAICAVYLDSGEEDDVMFFTAIQQMNKGKTELRDPNQRSMVASLNLKASRRAGKCLARFIIITFPVSQCPQCNLKEFWAHPNGRQTFFCNHW